MTYHDGKLTVPTPGRYYIYTQLFYRSNGRVNVCVNNHPVAMVQPRYPGTGRGTLYTGGVFNLMAGDVISLNVGFSITLYMASTHHTYFGAFLI